MQSSRSFVSQASISQSPLQQTRPQSIPTNGASFQHQFQNPNGDVQSPQQPTNPQYTSTTFQSPVPTPSQGRISEQAESDQKSIPAEDAAVFWSEGFVESPRDPAQSQSPYARSSRPKLANRLSSSAIKMPKKAYEASKDYVKTHPDAIKMPQKAYGASKDYMKAHPGRTTAIAGSIVGGIGVVAQACGANGLSDAVAASKIYLNIQRANQRKQKSHSLPKSPAHKAKPAVAQNHTSTTHSANPLTTHSADPSTTHSAGPLMTHSIGPSAKEVAHELFKIMQQGQTPLGQNAVPQNNSNPSPNQGGTFNPQGTSQQYCPPQFAQPQFTQSRFIPQQAPVQPIVPGPNIPYFVPPSQASPPLTTPDPSIADYQPPPSPTILTGNQTPPQPSQFPTPPLSFSDLSSLPPPLFDPSTLSPDPSTLQYDQFLQDQTSSAIANQAILSSQAFTTSLTGQDMFVPGDLGQSDTCSVSSMPLDVADANSDVSASWDEQTAPVEDYSSGDDDGCDYDSC
jgi:hypothetical protein